MFTRSSQCVSFLQMLRRSTLKYSDLKEILSEILSCICLPFALDFGCPEFWSHGGSLGLQVWSPAAQETFNPIGNSESHYHLLFQACEGLNSRIECSANMHSKYEIIQKLLGPITQRAAISILYRRKLIIPIFYIAMSKVRLLAPPVKLKSFCMERNRSSLVNKYL